MELLWEPPVMSSISPSDLPLSVLAIEDDIVFLGEGSVGFSMTQAAARATFRNLADALVAVPAARIAAQAVVLLVEDEPLLREVAAMILEDAGYLVIAAEGPRAALRILESGERIQLLFSDIQMGGDIDGLQLAREVAARWPAVPLLLTSGQAPRAAEPLPKGCRFLPKPYVAAEVARHVAELLAG
jgi:CheY-like chemotaxis protein